MPTPGAAQSGGVLRSSAVSNVDHRRKWWPDSRPPHVVVRADSMTWIKAPREYSAYKVLMVFWQKIRHRAQTAFSRCFLFSLSCISRSCQEAPQKALLAPPPPRAWERHCNASDWLARGAARQNITSMIGWDRWSTSNTHPITLVLLLLLITHYQHTLWEKKKHHRTPHALFFPYVRIVCRGASALASANAGARLLFSDVIDGPWSF